MTEKQREYCRAYRERHREEMRARARARYHADPKKERERAMRYLQTAHGREKNREYSSRPDVKARRLLHAKLNRATNGRREYERHYRRDNADKCTAATMRWRRTPAGTAKCLIAFARKRATKYGVPFGLDYADLLPVIERGVCERTGIPFERGGRRGPHVFSPSVDRIVPTLGYVRGNVQVVIWMYNRAKGCGTDADVIRMARALCAG